MTSPTPRADLRELARRIGGMRVTRAPLLALPAIVGGLAISFVGGSAAGACQGRFSCAGVRLPAPITIAAGHVLGSLSYRIGRDERVRRLPGIPPPFPRDAALGIYGVWYSIHHDHLVVGRGQRRLWRSHREFRVSNRDAWKHIGVVMVGSHTVAFTYDNRLYLAPLRGAGRQIARAEVPLGFTRAGLYTYRYRGRQLLLRSDSGALVKVVARQALGSDYGVADGCLYFIVHGEVMSARGSRTRRLVSLHRLGVSNPWLQPLGRLIELEDNNRLVVVRPDGQVFASTPLPQSGGQPDTISSSVAVAPRASAVAFVAAAGLPGGSGGSGDGTESVYLLRAGTHSAIDLDDESVTFAPCQGEGATLQWHGSWLLYDGTGGRLAAIDTTGTRHVIELSFVDSLRGARDGSNATWSR
jgi:hypothetical protein